MSDAAPALPAYMVALTPILNDVVAPAAAEVDCTGSYPRAAAPRVSSAARG